MPPQVCVDTQITCSVSLVSDVTAQDTFLLVICLKLLLYCGMSSMLWEKYRLTHFYLYTLPTTLTWQTFIGPAKAIIKTKTKKQ